MLDLSSSIKTNNTDEVRINCPFCETRGQSKDTKYKMYINTRKAVAHCFRCGYAKYNIFNKAIPIESLPKDLEKFGDSLSNLFSVKTVNTYDLDKFSWKVSQKETPIAYSYLSSRGFSQDDFDKHDIRVGHDYLDDGTLVKKWSGRVLFPYKEGNEVLFIVARAYAGKTPKYLNTAGQKSSVVYGLHEVTDGVAGICEGVIDAIAFKRATGIPAVCGLGKEYTEAQIQKIASKCHTIYEALDGDVDIAIRQKLCIMFERLGVKVLSLNLPMGEDPSSYSSNLTELVASAKEFRMFDYLFI